MAATPSARGRTPAKSPGKSGRASSPLARAKPRKSSDSKRRAPAAWSQGRAAAHGRALVTRKGLAKARSASALGRAGAKPRTLAKGRAARSNRSNMKQSAKDLAKGKFVAKAMSAAKLHSRQASRRAVPSKERGAGGPASSGKAKAPGGMPARSAKRKVAPRPFGKAVKARPAGKASGVKVALSRTSVSEVKSAGKQADGKTYTRLDHIDDATLDKIIAKLEEMRAESQATVNTQVSSALKPLSEEADVGDDMDLASRDRDREFNLLEHERHLRRLQQIAEAFERIKDGTYGLCEGTDEPINPKRLLIMPLARYSLEYQQEQEKMLGRTPEEFYFEEESALEGEEE